VLGGLIFGHPEPGRFTERHERLMTGLAAQAAIAIDNARLFQEVQTANATLEARVEERTAERDRTWNNARDLLLVVGTDGVFRAVNPAWKAILGWSADELVGRSYLEFIHPDDHPSSGDALENARKETLPVFENR
jgi:PAS domain-containing protein